MSLRTARRRASPARDVLEVDLFLQVLGAGRDQDALSAEDRRHQYASVLRCRSRLRQVHAAAFGRGPRSRPSPLSARGSKSECCAQADCRPRPRRLSELGGYRGLLAQRFDSADHRVRSSAEFQHGHQAATSISVSFIPRVVTAACWCERRWRPSADFDRRSRSCS